MATRRAPRIERTADEHAPLSLPAADFLRRYWQKHPLLIRGAFPGFRSPVTPEDLAGLACENVAPARLVRHDPRRDRWTLHGGPFVERDFTTLPPRHWTLLVQDCDKVFAEVGALLAHFRFLPDWRVDDIMISYAADGGSVGAHVDQYDVFLLQAEGRRRWMIDVDPAAPRGFRADAELKLLERFTPSHEWVLEPGDMLYLPPGVPHHGVAVGPCMTFSIGLRAPAVAELMADFVERTAERHGEDWRYADPDLAPAQDAARLDPAAVRRGLNLLREALDREPDAEDWFARFVTRYRSTHTALPRTRRLGVDALRRRLAGGERLFRSPWSRLAWIDRGAASVLYLGGDAFPCPAPLARRLAAARSHGAGDFRGCGAVEWAILEALVNAGHYALAKS